MTLRPTTAEQDLQILYHDLLESWTTGSGAAYARYFTDDADYIVSNGLLEKGRQQIAEGHQSIFDTWAKDTRLHGELLSVRLISTDVAILIARGAILHVGRELPAKDDLSIYMLVARKYSTDWLFTAYQNTPIQRY